MPNKVNLLEKLGQFQDYWHPRIVGDLNGQQVKLAKLKGEFIWHAHEQEDELFYVVEGSLDLEFRDRTVQLQAGEFIIVPKGVEHRPVAREEVSIMLFEPASTRNTGNVTSDLTRSDLERL
ncbi:MAG: cupin domain-containing protein [Lewinellaceae bacterium]|nr:cupin domain-containing protein [Saprospiraceae bacterium]MCB9312206.1 cupin domain-containing protein [Lewinellaceae bacterium]HRW75670.1 cupin domain-containing protein [Saprospiraceae bacterium]